MTSENSVLDEGTPAPVVDKNAPYVDERTGITIDPSRDENVTDFARATLTGFYMDQEETVQERYARAAKCYSSNPEHAQRLYDAVSKGYFMFASPPLSNATLPGEKMRGLPISCFLNEPADTVSGLIEHLKETEWLTVMGGGVGGFWNTRSESLKSSGLTPFQNVIDSLMGAFSQGVTRRGSYASYVRIDHPNFPEFLTIRTPTGDEGRKCHGTGYHHGAIMPDAFMEAVENDGDWDLIDPHSKQVKKTVKARELWEQMLDVRYRTGEPFMFYEENAQAGLHPALKAKGLRVKASNLCVVPETEILTDKGSFEISSLEGQTVNVWNGKGWSEVKIEKTGDAQKIAKVSLSDGSEIECTPYHKFYVMRGSKPQEVRASDLIKGDRLEKWELPVIENGEEWSGAYRNGFFSADGTYSSTGRSIIWLYSAEKKALAERIAEGTDVKARKGVRDALYFQPEDMKAKFTVPVNGNLSTKLEWLAGYLDGDGSVCRNGDNISLQAASVDMPFLRNIRTMLLSLGVQMKISLSRSARKTSLPDGRGGNRDYDCKPIYRGLITSCDTQKLLSLGLNCSRLKIDRQSPDRDSRRFISVDAVENEGRVSDTFCFNEAKRHRGLFNGILTGQCAEIMLPTTPDRTAVCCLSSLNCETADEWPPTLIPDLIEMLDNILTIFIDNAPPELWRAVASAKAERSVGLGLMGFHSYLQKNNVPFESQKARDINIELFHRIKAEAEAASLVLGGQRGEALDLAQQLRFVGESGEEHIISGEAEVEIVRNGVRMTVKGKEVTVGDDLCL